MCGIVAAIFSDDGPATVKAALATLVHRGPDQQAIVQEHRAVLGVNRLAVRDSKCQMALEPRAGCTLVFNGQIYQFAENGGSFQQVTTYSQESEVLSRLAGQPLYVDGMYAAISYDVGKEELTLVRDEFGIKPLFYRSTPCGVYAASELPTLVRLGGMPEINLDAVDEFVLFGRVLGRRTVFKDTCRVLPDEVVQISASGVTTRRRSRAGGVHPPCDQLRDAIRDAVHLAIASDRQVGIAVSGGLDSRILALHASEIGCDRLATISVGVGEHDGVTDLRHLKLPGSAWKTWEHSYARFNPLRFKKAFYQGIARLGQPSALTSLALYETLAELARNAGVVVLLVGEGADELFMGYDSYRRCLKWPNRLQSMMDFAMAGVESRIVSRLIGRSRVVGAIERFRQDVSCRSTWPETLRQFELAHSLEPLLERTDSCLMGRSIEGRPPFLAGKVPSIALACDPFEGVGDCFGKTALRSAYPEFSEVVKRPFRIAGDFRAECLRELDKHRLGLEDLGINVGQACAMVQEGGLNGTGCLRLLGLSLWSRWLKEARDL